MLGREFVVGREIGGTMPIETSPQPKKKKVVLQIFEGPAGSGKSYAIKKALENSSERYRLVPNYHYTGMRDFGIEADKAVFLKDYDRLWRTVCLMTNDMEFNGFLYDRLWFSQIVYEHLRGYQPLKHNELAGRTKAAYWNLRNVFYSMYRDYTTRWWKEPIALDVQFSFTFILPIHDVLEKRRLRTGKDYPFSRYQETEAYHTVANELKRHAQVVKFIDVR